MSRKFSIQAAFSVLAAALILTGCTAAPQSAATTEPQTPAGASAPVEMQGTVWTANEHGNSISVIDARTNEVITTLTGVEGPHNLQAAPDGKTIWAVSGHESLALMIDAATMELHGTVPTGSQPAHIILTLDGKTAYATNGGDNTVTVIDVESMEAVATRRQEPIT